MHRPLSLGNNQADMVLSFNFSISVCCQGKCPHKDKGDTAAATAGPEGTEATPQSPVDEGASTSTAGPMVCYIIQTFTGVILVKYYEQSSIKVIIS